MIEPRCEVLSMIEPLRLIAVLRAVKPRCEIEVLRQIEVLRSA